MAAMLQELKRTTTPQHAPWPGPSADKAACSTCSFRRSCLPAGLPAAEHERLESLLYLRRRVKRGEVLYHARDAFRALYAVRMGSFKTTFADEDGREQVTGFFIGGELLGIDGLASGTYESRAVALEDAEVCVLPYALLEDLSREMPALQRHMHAVLAREIVRNHGVMMLLGSLNAEQRLASFLLNMSARYAARGYSASEFHLRMTREELGTYLGLTLETVSRLFTRFQKAGLIAADHKHLRILDLKGVSGLLAA